MKQVKFFLVALMAMVMGMSVTSCINGDDNNIVSVPGSFVQVVHDFPIYFKDAYGYKLIPDQSIMSADGEMALIAYQYDRSTVAENATSVNITLLGSPYYMKKSYVSTSFSVAANAPVMTLEPTTNMGTLKGGFFDKNVMILPVAYKNKKYEKDSDNEVEANRHSFGLAYDSEEGFKNGVLTLHLCHHADEIPDENGDGKPVERTNNTFDYKAFDLSVVLSTLSSTPSKIDIVIDQNETNDKFKEKKETTFSFEYSFK